MPDWVRMCVYVDLHESTFVCHILFTKGHKQPCLCLDLVEETNGK